MTHLRIMLHVVSPCHVCPLARNREPPNDSPSPPPRYFILESLYYFDTCTVHILFCTVTNKCKIISQIITPTCFDTRVILRELVINTLSSYTTISNAVVGNTIYN